MAIYLEPFSPVAVSILGFDVRWYALAYITAFIVGYFLFKYLMRRGNIVNYSKKQMDDFLSAIILGVIIGGRLGYVLFYNLSFFIAHPLEIFMVWHGGMSFHGGLIGVIVANFLFARRNKTNCLAALDLLAIVSPVGLFFGRIANFINMEIMGRPTNAPWGIVFYNSGTNIPRHPSPLYEAMTEGILLFAIMICLYRFTKLRKFPGALAGIMGMVYAIARIFCEQFRMPDAQLGFLTSWGLTMGQLLSGVMFIVGALLFVFAFRKK